MAVLERAGLALVAVHRHQPRPGRLPHQRPLAPGGKAGAAEAAQAGIVDRLDGVLARALVPRGIRRAACSRPARDMRRNRSAAGAHARARFCATASLTTFASSACITCTWPTAQTGARSHAPMHGARTTRTPGPSFAGRRAEQMLRAGHRAGKRIAHPHRDRRRRDLAFLHDVEMRVEGRDLVDFGLRELHLGGERREMRGGEMAVAVLDQMQVLDQQIAPARPVAEQRATSASAAGSSLAAFRRSARTVLLRPAAVIDWGTRVHLWLSLAFLSGTELKWLIKNNPPMAIV